MTLLFIFYFTHVQLLSCSIFCSVCIENEEIGQERIKRWNVRLELSWIWDEERSIQVLDWNEKWQKTKNKQPKSKGKALKDILKAWKTTELDQFEMIFSKNIGNSCGFEPPPNKFT